MPSVVHVVATDAFAGVERYVADVARETAARGWDVTVVGGDPERMAAVTGPAVRCLAGAGGFAAAAALARVRGRDVCNAHMTVAEVVSASTQPLHRAPVVSTRHFAAARGASARGRLVRPWVATRLARELAVSSYVASHVERPPDAVVPAGVTPSALLWSVDSRTVLVVQRLEPEKDSKTALRAWRLSGLAAEGWTLRVVGDGAERAALEAAASDGVEFAGWSRDVPGELARAAVLLAPAQRDAFGLTVVEAMVAGIPVVAAAGGGHLETVGLLPDAPLFAPGDAEAAAAALRSLVDDAERARLSAAGRRLVAERFTLASHVDALLEQYEAVR